MNGYKMINKGQFVLTIVGYNKTPDRVKHERTVGKPLKGFETKVPRSWYDNGWVEIKEV